MRQNRAFITILTALAVFCLAADEPKATVRLKKLVEEREVEFEKSNFSGFDNEIRISLHVDGPDVQNARKYRDPVVSSAVDDVGTDLTVVPKGGPRFGSPDSWNEVRTDRGVGFGINKNKQSTGFELSLRLPTSAPRKATTIKSLAGHIPVLAGGEKKVIEVKNLKGQIGKTLDDPALKDMKIAITFLDPAKKQTSSFSKNFVPVQIAGDRKMMDVEIVDAAGESVSRGMMSTEAGGVELVSYDLEKPLSDDMVMKITVYPGQKLINVPFKFEDIKLP